MVGVAVQPGIGGDDEVGPHRADLVDGDAEQAARMRSLRRNPRYLPEVALPPGPTYSVRRSAFTAAPRSRLVRSGAAVAA